MKIMFNTCVQKRLTTGWVMVKGLKKYNKHRECFALLVNEMGEIAVKVLNLTDSPIEHNR